MANMRDYMGAEHFPACPCFQQNEDLSNQMYTLVQEHANSIVAEMMMAGYCESAMPFAIAMLVNMCVSMIASSATSREHPDINPHSLTVFSEKQHQLLGRVKDRQDALMQRADIITFASQGGSSSVQ